MNKISQCNICNGTDFKKGPLGRLAISGDKPQCSSCGSLERHRILRTVWRLLPTDYLNKQKALQFSLDPSVDPSWFLNLETSVYGHTNSLDIQNINKPSNSYDIVICNQILEHVKDDKKAFSELLRILKNTGILQITVPIPISKSVTDDWGYPKEDFHGHYRHYGIDLIEYFKSVSPEISLINIRAQDKITGSEDYIFFWMKSLETRDFLLKLFSGKADIERYF